MSAIRRVLVILGLEPRRHRRNTPLPVAKVIPASPQPGDGGRAWKGAPVPAKVPDRGARRRGAASLDGIPGAVDPTLDDIDDELLRIVKTIA